MKAEEEKTTNVTDRGEEALSLNMEMLGQIRAREPLIKIPTVVCKAIVDEAFEQFGTDLDAVFLETGPRKAEGLRMVGGYIFHVVYRNLDQHWLKVKDWESLWKICRDQLISSGTAQLEFHPLSHFNVHVLRMGGLDPCKFHELYRRRSSQQSHATIRRVFQMDQLDFPTAQHEEAYERLVQLAELHFDHETRQAIGTLCGCMQPRTFPLITGPSACGKTFMAKLLAQKIGAKLMMVSAANWVPKGAELKPGTAGLILMNILKHERVVLLIDEIDKLNDNTMPNGWSISCRGDIFALLDGNEDFEQLQMQLRRSNSSLLNEIEERGISCQDLATKRLFVVGAGTWQEEYRRHARRASIGFHEEEETPSISMREHLKGNQLMAEEFRNRFHSELIELRHPTQKEGRELLKRKGIVDLALTLGMGDLIDAIDWPNGGMRNVEAIIAKLAIAYRGTTAWPTTGKKM